MWWFAISYWVIIVCQTFDIKYTHLPWTCDTLSFGYMLRKWKYSRCIAMKSAYCGYLYFIQRVSYLYVLCYRMKSIKITTKTDKQTDTITFVRFSLNNTPVDLIFIYSIYQSTYIDHMFLLLFDKQYLNWLKNTLYKIL